LYGFILLFVFLFTQKVLSENKYYRESPLNRAFKLSEQGLAYLAIFSITKHARLLYMNLQFLQNAIFQISELLA
jgi:hypothetical protein